MKLTEPHANLLPRQRSPEPSASSTAVTSRANSVRNSERQMRYEQTFSEVNVKSLLEVIKTQRTTIQRLEHELTVCRLKEVTLEVVHDTEPTHEFPVNYDTFLACRRLVSNLAKTSSSFDSSLQSNDSIKVELLALPDYESEDEGRMTQKDLKKVRRMERTVAKHEAFILQLKSTLESMLEERNYSRIQHLKSLQEIKDLKARLSSTMDFRPSS
jgi:hypothetical protein